MIFTDNAFYQCDVLTRGYPEASGFFTVCSEEACAGCGNLLTGRVSMRGLSVKDGHLQALIDPNAVRI